MESSGPRILGVYETVLYAPDVEATAAFYADLPGVRLLRRADALNAALRVDDGRVLLIFDPARSSDPDRFVPHGATGPGHVAFSVASGTLDAWADELRARGVEIEREITWSQGGRSVYVRDPAGNSVELIEGEAWPP